MRNSAKGIRNPTNDCNPESRFHYQRIRNPESGIQNPSSTCKESGIQRVESRIQDSLGFPYMEWYQFLSLYIKGRCWQDSLLLGNPVDINASPITLIDLAFLNLIVFVWTMGSSCFSTWWPKGRNGILENVETWGRICEYVVMVFFSK